MWGMVLVGYTLGRTVPNVDKKIHYIIAGVIVVSLMPAAYHAWKSGPDGGLIRRTPNAEKSHWSENAKREAWQLPVLFTR